MDIQNKTLGKNLKKAREDNFLTKEQLADKLEIDTEVLIEYEKGTIDNIDINLVEHMAQVLNIELSELIDWHGNSLGEIIKYRRKELGLTQKDIANYADVTHSAVSRWESGEIENITQDKIVALSEILKISPLQLMAPDSKDNIYQVKQEYLHIAKRLQDLNIPADICNEIIDIFIKIKES